MPLTLSPKGGRVQISRLMRPPARGPVSDPWHPVPGLAYREDSHV
jgi:hypothetical protein